jgi:hypothetical protein
MNPLLDLPTYKLKHALGIRSKIERLERKLGKLVNGTSQPVNGDTGKRRHMSAAARRKIGAAMKARWARFHAAKGK